MSRIPNHRHRPIFRHDKSDDEEEDSSAAGFMTYGNDLLDSNHHHHSSTASSHLSEIEPLTPQTMDRENSSIKVLTGTPLLEYVPQRRPRGSQTTSSSSLLMGDVGDEPQRSKPNKNNNHHHVSFQSPPMQKIPRPYHQRDGMDDSPDGGDDGSCGTPMNYFPSKYRMEQAKQRSALVKTDTSRNDQPYLHHHSISSSPGDAMAMMSSPSPSNQSQMTMQSNFSHQSNYSQRSHDSSRLSSVMSYRSSTSKSILFGEVINLEETRRGGAQHHQHSRYNKDDCENQYPKDFVGMEIGGGGGRNNSAGQMYHTAIPLPLEENDNNHSSSNNFRHFPLGISAASFLNIVRDAKNLGHTAHYGIKEIGVKSVAKTRQLLHYYRPPMSPRTKALRDLEFLQKAHKEKVGQFIADDGLEEHWDFALVLTPQEVYRFWSSLLDFRVEHLGSEALFESMEPSLKSASTDSTDNTYNSSSSSPDESPSSSPEQQQEAGFSTPVTGIKRRRGRTTPPSDNKQLLLRSTAKSIFTAADTEVTGITTGTGRFKQRLSMFDKAIAEQQGPPSKIKEPRTSDDNNRRRWGNHTRGSLSTQKNLLSPPVRSLTRGVSSIQKAPRPASLPSIKPMDAVAENDEETGREGGVKLNPNVILSEYDIPNQVIPRGIAARTNGLLQFLSVLQRGIVLRRHRSNKEAVYCKIFSNDGGDTIQYQLIDPEEAMVAFKEQRVRYNRNLTHSSSPTSVRAVARDWACLDGPGEGSSVHKFKVPDHVAAQKYREEFAKEHGVSKRLIDLATKAANSGIIKAADVVAVHPASHLDPRHPGVRRGELGTASLRKSKSDHFTPHTFSIVTSVSKSFAPAGKTNQNEGSENKWYGGEGTEIQFKTIDFEAATEGEYWLIFRGFLLLHRDATVGRFAAERRAGIGGGSRNREQEDGQDREFENILHRDEFLEPKTVGRLQRLIVKLRDMDTTFMEGDMVAGARPPPSDYFLGFKAPGTQIWSRLRLAGLETQRLYAVDTNRVMIKVRCPEDRLTDVAEVLRLKLRTNDGGFAPFREDAADHFLAKNDMLDVPSIYQGNIASLLGSKERQTILDFIIGSRIRDSGAELAKNTDVGNMIQARVPLHMPRKLDALYNLWVSYWKYENWTAKNWGALEDESVYGGSEAGDNDRPVPGFLSRLLFGAFHQPLDAIEEYFGEQVTFYFAWLEHCSWHLLVMTVLGLLVTVCQLSTDNFDHPIRPFFSVVVMIWTFMVLINWRKRNSFLAHRWGSLDVEVHETPRAEFYGDYVMDEVTREWVIKYPAWKRWLKYLISAPISFAFTSLSVLLILVIHANRDLQIAKYVESQSNPNAEPFKFEFSLDNIGRKAPIVDVPITKELLLDPTFWVVLGALPCVLGLCIPIMNLILMIISRKLNDFENYKTDSEYRTHLIIKVFSFRFVGQFGTVYYYAAISTGSRQAVENGIIRMGTSLIMYTTIAHWWNIFLQVYFFMGVRNIRRSLYKKRLRQELKNIELEEESLQYCNLSDVEEREVRLINKRMLLDQAQDDVWFECMNPPHDSFPEYITAVLQFAFVACFSVVLPIIPFFVLLNYLLSMRYDAYKICRGRQRPLAQKTGGMGVWEDLLHIVAVIAVLTNCWLIAFTNFDFIELTDSVGTMGIFAIVIGWEHLMLLIKYVMQSRISHLPKSVRDELKRKHHDQEQERYSTMRLRNGIKKTESQRTLRRAPTIDHDESVSLLSRDLLTPARESFESAAESGILYSC